MPGALRMDKRLNEIHLMVHDALRTEPGQKLLEFIKSEAATMSLRSQLPHEVHEAVGFRRAYSELIQSYNYVEEAK